MISSWNMQEANSPTLKRSFAHIADPESSLPHDYAGWDTRSSTFAPASELTNRPPLPSPTKRRSLSVSQSSSMPVQASPPSLPASFPSFMSVFGGGSSLRGNRREGNTATHASCITPSFSQPKPADNLYQQSQPFQHRESVTSVSSASTDSSPTTTISTFDSSSITDPSPSSSPESPTSVVPLSPFKSMKMEGQDKPPDEELQRPVSKPLPSLPQGPESPGRNPRNMKNLSLNMNTSSAPRPTISTASAVDTSHPLSAPSSPAVGPTKVARRKPNGLTIMTPGFDTLTFASNATKDALPNLGMRPSLRHFESSPSLPSIFSPSAPPEGGMRLPPPLFSRILSRPNQDTEMTDQNSAGASHPIPQSQGLHDLREEDDRHCDPPQSQEANPRGYRNGPVRIYDSGVFLYLEPTREEASNFDVVINVAKEVVDPFIQHADTKDTVMSIWRRTPSEFDRQSIPEPHTAMSEISFKSAFEWPPSAVPASPTTPKAELTEPEYIHAQWDHNSEIVEDLYPLCQIIDDRVSSGKKVLIHCQLGVSRSASLIVAYGLYKNPKVDFHEMYGLVKERSQWVGPNMSLIYQLMDFRSKVSRGSFKDAKQAPGEWFKSGGTSSNTIVTPKPAHAEVFPLPQRSVVASGTQPYSYTSSGTQTDPTTQSMEGHNFSKPLPPVPAFGSIDLGFTSTTSSSSTTPAPSSNPSSTSLSSQASKPKRTISPPRALPLRAMQPLQIPPLVPQDPSTRLGLSIPHQSVEMDLVMNDVPDLPSLLSPRATEFMATPFPRTVAGDLATDNSTPMSPGGAADVDEDPRSPHQRGEPVVMRSIDDFL